MSVSLNKEREEDVIFCLLKDGIFFPLFVKLTRHKIQVDSITVNIKDRISNFSKVKSDPPDPQR
jgi:hypothetical protein